MDIGDCGGGDKGDIVGSGANNDDDREIDGSGGGSNVDGDGDVDGDDGNSDGGGTKWWQW